MNILHNTKKVILLSTTLSALLTTANADAGILRVINHSSNNIQVNIIPEPSYKCFPYCWKCLDKSSSLSGQSIKEIIVPLDAFKGNEYFAVEGTEGGFIFTGECRNLNVFKNYEISFYENSLNVSCKSKEI